LVFTVQALFVSALKNERCTLFGDVPRQERDQWKQRLPSPNPPMRPRDKDQDWGILTGEAAAISTGAVASTRAVRLFFCSSLTDTVLEWSFFLQDCIPFLEQCARNRDLDLDVRDMRRGLREEDGLPLETMLAQLRLCQEQSAGVNCIVITGDKRGPSAAPRRIGEQEFKQFLEHVDSQFVDSFKGRYELDKNQLPEPEYVLRAVDPGSKAALRSEEFSALKKAAMKFFSGHDNAQEKEKLERELRDPKRYVLATLLDDDT